nr:ribonuclease H-like domain-containing protein [Tanacetum cinerariifolium]
MGGLRIASVARGCQKYQTKYATEIIEKAHMLNCNPCRTPIDTEKKLGLQQLCLYMHDPREPQLNAMKCVLRYLRGTTNLGLQLFRSTTSQLIAYYDADWAYMLSRSSVEAEYHRIANAVAETSWIRNLLRELHTPLFTMTLMKESKVVLGKAVDDDLVVIDSSETESGKHDTSSSSGNYITHVVDADIRIVNEKCHLLRNHLVIRQPNVFKSERPRISKPRFASQVDVKHHLPKPVTPHYLPNFRKSAPVKPHHVNAPSSSRNYQKESYGSNDMAHNHILEEARKKTQDQNWNLKPREMSSTRTHHTPNACTPKPRSNNQTFRNWPASKSSNVKFNVVQKADHFRNPSSCSDSKHLVYSTCHKCVFNANHDACVTKFLKEVNSHAKIQSSKFRNSIKPVRYKSNVNKPKRRIFKGHRLSPKKSFNVHDKTSPRS